jgi:tetratricopeptide (TPR) repeat protein
MSSSVASAPVVAGGTDGNVAVDEAYQKIQFLLDISRRLDEDGNVLEAVKSTETALILRRNSERLYPELAHRFTTSLLKQSQELVLKCNSVAVASFQDNNYDAASFLLNKALFLTDEFEETRLFGDADHDRLRLRAATYNNLGCLEKRRGRLHPSLDHLQKAAQLEVSVDPDVGASPSTYLNLCTVLNKLGNHVAAVSAAQRAIDTLHFQAQQGLDQYPNYPVMLAVAFYNLGASLESCDRPGDVAQALEAYQSVLDTEQRYRLDPSNPTVRQASEALRRIQSTQPNALVLPRATSRGGAAPRMFTTAMHSAPQVNGRASGELVPVPPKQKRTEGAAPYTLSSFRVSVANQNGGSQPTGALGDAANRHAERIQARQRKKQENAERDQMALQRAQRAHVKEKEEKQRREREAEASRREEMAKALYEKMVHGLRADEIKRVKNAAKKIQKIFRGFMARTLVGKMQQSATKIQSVVRSWLTRVHIHRSEEERQQRAAREANYKRQSGACIRIQERIRMFLRRLELIRQHRARKLRRHCCAKAIQRVFRLYCQRREQRVLAQMEAERTADERRSHLQHDAARKIQHMFRNFKMRRITRVVSMEQKRRSEAATSIQALVRGVLTRVWFKHYRMYRRQQELSSSKNLRAIIRIQGAWRSGLARRNLHRRRTEHNYRQHVALVFKSARTIQCAIRCFLACKKVRPLRALHHRRLQAVDKIQRIYIMFRTRCAYLRRRDAARRMKSAALIQTWFRERLITNKHNETARYHAAIQRRQRLALLQTQGAVLLQAVMQMIMSSRIVDSMRNTFLKQSAIALIVQKAGRGLASRRDTSVLKSCAKVVDERRRVAQQRNGAACVIQRATRCFLAKRRTENLRLRRAAALMISKTYRMHRGKQELRALRAERDAIRREKSVRVIQKLARKFIRRLELRRLDEYYAEKHLQKRILMRKEEAAVSIQAIWRGHATRRETTAERNRLLQNTIDAIRIQRQFRAFRFRTQINAEVSRRQSLKRQRRIAAIKIQSFWRGVLAREYVNVLQETRYNRTVCAIAIQCAWRRFSAIAELHKRRAIRVSHHMLRAKQHDLWVTSITTVATFMRAMFSSRLRLSRLRYSVISALTEKQRETFYITNTAATKIQANYRGYYERTYSRGLRREKREQERLATLRRVKQERAALRIQCAWRSAVARSRTYAIRQAKREALLAQQLETEAAANPQDVVKRLFWTHEAKLQRSLVSERLKRHANADAAAIHIQKNVRMMLAIHKYAKQREQRRNDDAAARIQSQWRERQEEVARQQHEKQFLAALRIQALVRGIQTRRRWDERQQVLTNRRGSAVQLEDRRDQAAIKIQSCWRMWAAQARAHGIRAGKHMDAVLQLHHESARLIQKHFRGLLARTRVEAIRNKRQEGEAADAGQDDAPPVPPRTVAQ